MTDEIAITVYLLLMLLYFGGIIVAFHIDHGHD